MEAADDHRLTGDKIAALAAPRSTLFHTPDEKEPYAAVDIPVDDDWLGEGETVTKFLPVRGGELRMFLRALAFARTGRGLAREALEEAAETFAARAVFAGDARPVGVRVMAHEEEGERLIVYDLGRESGEVVVGAGWREIRKKSPSAFRNPPGQLEMPLPAAPGEGDLDPLRDLPNVRDEDWPLAVGGAFGGMFDTGPYPCVFNRGEQGTAVGNQPPATRRAIPSRTSTDCCSV